MYYANLLRTTRSNALRDPDRGNRPSKGARPESEFGFEIESIRGSGRFDPARTATGRETTRPFEAGAPRARFLR